jgi:sulfur relay (sulfurtransferase) complex TusBCD TusD component (DsrE family)
LHSGASVCAALLKKPGYKHTCPRWRRVLEAYSAPVFTCHKSCTYRRGVCGLLQPRSATKGAAIKVCNPYRF